MLLSLLSSKYDSHINFPGKPEAFAVRCRYQANEQTRRLFSHKISYGALKWLEWRHHFSHINFLARAENVIRTSPKSEKRGKSQQRNFI